MREGVELNLQEYKNWYESEYKRPPGMKCIESFQKLHHEQEPDPTAEEFFEEPEPVLPQFKFTKV